MNNVNTASDVALLPPALKHFKFFANKLTSSFKPAKSTHPTVLSIQGHLNNYLAEIQQYPGDEDELAFWRLHHACNFELFERLLLDFAVSLCTGLCWMGLDNSRRLRLFSLVQT